MEKNFSTTFVILLAVSALVSASFGFLGGFVSNQYFSLTSNVSGIDIDRNIVRLIEEESSAIAVVQQVTPAVVSIVAKQKKSAVSNQIFSPFDFYYGNSLPTDTSDSDQLVEVGAGTGFFVTSDGYIVTNRHVVDFKDAFFTIITNDDQEFPATVIDTDPFFDIAILKVEGTNFSIATFGDSDNIEVGQTVIAIGNALSQYQNSVTKGVISGVNRRISAYDYSSGSEVIEGAIQTDAAINPGNSGGPLINLMGEVVGMNSAVSSNGQGLGFAIPVNEIKQAVESVQSRGEIVRPWLGVRFTMISKEYAEENDLGVDRGALIAAGDGQEAVVKGSPADKAGLLKDDIITEVDGLELTEETSLSLVVRRHLAGETLDLKIWRDGAAQEIFVTLEEYKETE